MTSDLRPYPEYRDSGVPWLGRIPAHWDVRRLRDCGRIVGGGTPSMKRGDFWGGRVPWVSPKDMKVADIVDSRDHITEVALRECNISLLNPPAILIVVRGMILARRVPVAVTRVPVTINQDMKALLPRDDVDARYVGYAIETSRDAFSEIIDEAGHGTKRLPTTRWRQLEVWMPPLPEQKAIADYLDAHAAKVRRFIRNRRRLIEVLNEQKQAIINRAVTRGLDPSVSLKPSGIDWLGDIPEHWKVVALRYLATKFGSGVTPRGGATVYRQTGVPFLRSQNVHFDGLRLDGVARIEPSLHASLSGTHVRPNDVLLNITGASIGRVCAVPRDFADGNVNQHVCIIRPSVACIGADYLAAYLSTGFMQREIYIEQNGASREGLALDAIRTFKVILPPLAEQRAIMNHVRTATKCLVMACHKAEREIALIREYRTRLIADVVMGKLDVRHLAPVEPPAADDLADEDLEDGIDAEDALGAEVAEVLEEAADTAE